MFKQNSILDSLAPRAKVPEPREILHRSSLDRVKMPFSIRHLFLWRQSQGRRKHQKIGGGTSFQGHFGILKRAPKQFFPEMLATGEGEKKFSRHSIPKLHVFDQIFFKNLD